MSETKIQQRILYAPCQFCGYSGPHYWQTGTHDEACPWFKIGGEREREQALISFGKNITGLSRLVQQNEAMRRELDLSLMYVLQVAACIVQYTDSPAISVYAQEIMDRARRARSTNDDLGHSTTDIPPLFEGNRHGPHPDPQQDGLHTDRESIARYVREKGAVLDKNGWPQDRSNEFRKRGRAMVAKAEDAEAGGIRLIDLAAEIREVQRVLHHVRLQVNRLDPSHKCAAGTGNEKGMTCCDCGEPW